MARISISCVLLLLATSLAFSQTVVRSNAPCVYGCGPFIPLVTTPSVSLQSVSPNPVGASNATAGLAAGATNATLNQVPASSIAEYTQPVWYSGASTPETTPAVNVLPVASILAPAEEHHHHVAMHSKGYFTGAEQTSNVVESAANAKNARHATRTVTNSDIDRVNQETGTVKYKGKTERID
jgi:hypothetical protein